MWTFLNVFFFFRNWFDKVKLCSIDVGRHLCSGLSFNPTNWRQLCTVSSDILTLWNIGQLNTKYTLVSRFLHFKLFYLVLLINQLLIAFWFISIGFLIIQAFVDIWDLFLICFVWSSCKSVQVLRYCMWLHSLEEHLNFSKECTGISNAKEKCNFSRGGRFKPNSHT